MNSSVDFTDITPINQTQTSASQNVMRSPMPAHELLLHTVIGLVNGEKVLYLEGQKTYTSGLLLA